MKNYTLKLTQADFSPTSTSGTFRSSVIDLYDNESYRNYSTTKSVYGLDLLGNGVWTGLNQLSETETECGFIADDKFIDTTGRIDLYSFDISFSNRIGTGSLSSRFNLYYAPEADADFPFEFTSIENMNAAANPIEFDVDRYLVLEMVIFTTENIDDIGYELNVDLGIDGPIIAPLFNSTRRMLNKFPSWTDLYEDSGYGGATPPIEYLDPLATPNFVGSSLVNSISGRWVDELEFWIKKHGVEQYIGTADINQKTHTYLTEAALLNHIVRIEGNGQEIPRVSSLYDYHQLLEDEDGVYIDPIEGGIFSNKIYSNTSGFTADVVETWPDDGPFESSTTDFEWEILYDNPEGGLDVIDGVVYSEVGASNSIATPLQEGVGYTVSTDFASQEFGTTATAWVCLISGDPDSDPLPGIYAAQPIVSSNGYVLSVVDDLPENATAAYLIGVIADEDGYEFSEGLDFTHQVIIDYTTSLDSGEIEAFTLAAAASLENITISANPDTKIIDLYLNGELIHSYTSGGSFVSNVETLVLGNVEGFGLGEVRISYDPIDVGMITINGEDYRQNYSPIWNWFDEFGLLVDLYRLPQEGNLRFKQRILDVYKNQPGVTLARFKKAIRRELDLWYEDGATPDSDYLGATPEIYEIEDLENLVDGSTPYVGYDDMPTDRFVTLAKRLKSEYPILWDHFKYNQAFWDVTGFNNEAMHYLPYRYDATPAFNADWLITNTSVVIGMMSFSILWTETPFPTVPTAGQASKTHTISGIPDEDFIAIVNGASVSAGDLEGAVLDLQFWNGVMLHSVKIAIEYDGDTTWTLVYDPDGDARNELSSYNSAAAAAAGMLVIGVIVLVSNDRETGAISGTSNLFPAANDTLGVYAYAGGVRTKVDDFPNDILPTEIRLVVSQEDSGINVNSFSCGSIDYTITTENTNQQVGNDENYSPGIGAGDDLYVYKPNVPVTAIDFSADIEVRGKVKSYRIEYPELSLSYDVSGHANRIEYFGPEITSNCYLQFTIDGVEYTHNVELTSQSDIYFGQATPSDNSLVSLTTILPDGSFDPDAIIYDDDGDLVAAPEDINIYYDLDPSTDIVFGFGYYNGDTNTLVTESPIEDLRVGWMDHAEGGITAGTYSTTRDSTTDGFMMPVVINYEVSDPIEIWGSTPKSYVATLNGGNTGLEQVDYEHDFTEDIPWDPNLAVPPDKFWKISVTSTDGYDGNPSASYLSYDNTVKYLPLDKIEVTIDPVVTRWETYSVESDYFVSSEADYISNNDALYIAPGALVHGRAEFSLDTILPDPIPTATISIGVRYASAATLLRTYSIDEVAGDYNLMRGATIIHTWPSIDQALMGIDSTKVVVDYLDTAGSYTVTWKTYVGGVLVDTTNNTAAHASDISHFAVTLHNGSTSADGYIVVSDSRVQVSTNSATARWVDGVAEIPYGTDTVTFSSLTSTTPEYPEPDDKAFVRGSFTATIPNAIEGTVDENGIWRNGQPSLYQSKYDIIDSLRLSRDDFGLDETDDIFISWIGITSNNSLVDVWLDTNTVKSEAADLSENINYGNSYINEVYDEDLDTYYLDRVVVKARLKKAVDPHWYPQVHSGYTYIAGEERYMYIEPAYHHATANSALLSGVVRQGAPVIAKTNHATPIQMRQVAFHDATPALTLTNEEVVSGSGAALLYVGYRDIYDIEVFDLTDGVEIVATSFSTDNAVHTATITDRTKEYRVSYKVRNSFYVDSSEIHDGIHRSSIVFDSTPSDGASQYDIVYESSKHYPATPIDISLNPFYTTVNEGFIFVTVNDYDLSTIELRLSPGKFTADDDGFSLLTIKAFDVYGNPKEGVTTYITTDFGTLGGLTDFGMLGDGLSTDADGFASAYITYSDSVPVDHVATIEFTGAIEETFLIPVSEPAADEYVIAATIKDDAIIADGGPGATIAGIVLDVGGNPAPYAVIRYRKGRTIYDVFDQAYSNVVVPEAATPSWTDTGRVVAGSDGRFTIGPFLAATPGDPGYWFVAVESQGATPISGGSTPGTDSDDLHAMVGDVVYWYEYPESLFGVEPISNQPVLPANIVAADAATPLTYQSAYVTSYELDSAATPTNVEPNWLPPKWYALDKYQQYKLGILGSEAGTIDYSQYDNFHPDHKDF